MSENEKSTLKTGDRGYLHELGAAQVEHELRVIRHLRCHDEGLRLVLAVVPEARSKANEGAVEPAGGVEVFLRLHLVGG